MPRRSAPQNRSLPTTATRLLDGALGHLRDAVELLERTATPEELDDYKRFVLNVADKVANAHREGGESVSADERAAIEAIAANLGTAAP